MNKPVTYLGVDPGTKGAFCLLIKHHDKKLGIHFMDNKSDNKTIFAWLCAADSELNVRMAMLEDVHSLFGMSAKSNFGFGREAGRASALLSIHSFGLDLVAPKVWQKEVGVKLPVKKKGTKKVKSNPIIKKEVERLCNTLYPDCEIYGPKGGLHDGRSDSLMIAHYCMLKYK